MKARTHKRWRHGHSVVPGAAPGTLVAHPEAEPTRMRVMAYDAEGFVESELEGLDGLDELRRRWAVVWIDLSGFRDVEILRLLGEELQLHRLVLEDVVNLGQRAKVEAYDNQIFAVARMPGHDAGTTDQVSLVLAPGIVVTFQDRAGDCFDGVRERIRHGRGLLRRTGADYLVYTLLDSVVDAYFPVLEQIGTRLEALEDEVIADPGRPTLARILEIKRTLTLLRKAIWPHREAVNTLLRDAPSFFAAETTIHLRDCYDHAIRIAELVEAYREFTGDLMNTYLSSISNRMNEVMKVLTVIATIFIPLSFVTGLYGMNFDPGISPWNMPELGWYWGYPFALGLMAAMVVGLTAYFWRKGWFR